MRWIYDAGRAHEPVVLPALIINYMYTHIKVELCSIDVAETCWSGVLAELRPKDPRLAFDICPCNMLLNNLALRLETGAKDFDDNGSAASEGKVIDSLLERLDSLDYYSKPPGPKSLGREWFEQNILPAVDASVSSKA